MYQSTIQFVLKLYNHIKQCIHIVQQQKKHMVFNKPYVCYMCYIMFICLHKCLSYLNKHTCDVICVIVLSHCYMVVVVFNTPIVYIIHKHHILKHTSTSKEPGLFPCPLLLLACLIGIHRALSHG